MTEMIEINGIKYVPVSTNQKIELNQLAEAFLELLGPLIQKDRLTYTTAEVAELLHTHDAQINQLRILGALKGIKKGKEHIFPRKVIEEFLIDYLDMNLSNPTNIRLAVQEVQRKKAQLSKGRSQ